MEQIRKQIKEYIKVDPRNQNILRVDFDSMCAFLIQSKRSFSPAELETSLNKELQKLVNVELTPQVFDAIAKYVDEKTLWLEAQDRQEKHLRLEELKWVKQVESTEQRAERMAEVYRRRSERRSKRTIS